MHQGTQRLSYLAKQHIAGIYSEFIIAVALKVIPVCWLWFCFKLFFGSYNTFAIYFVEKFLIDGRFVVAGDTFNFKLKIGSNVLASSFETLVASLFLLHLQNAFCRVNSDHRLSLHLQESLCSFVLDVGRVRTASESLIPDSFTFPLASSIFAFSMSFFDSFFLYIFSVAWCIWF